MTEKKICNLSYTSGNNLNNIKTPLVNIEGKRKASKFLLCTKKLNSLENINQSNIFSKGLKVFARILFLFCRIEDCEKYGYQTNSVILKTKGV